MVFFVSSYFRDFVIKDLFLYSTVVKIFVKRNHCKRQGKY